MFIFLHYLSFVCQTYMSLIKNTTPKDTTVLTHGSSGELYEPKHPATFCKSTQLIKKNNLNQFRQTDLFQHSEQFFIYNRHLRQDFEAASRLGNKSEIESLRRKVGRYERDGLFQATYDEEALKKAKETMNISEITRLTAKLAKYSKHGLYHFPKHDIAESVYTKMVDYTAGLSTKEFPQVPGFLWEPDQLSQPQHRGGKIVGAPIIFIPISPFDSNGKGKLKAAPPFDSNGKGKLKAALVKLKAALIEKSANATESNSADEIYEKISYTDDLTKILNNRGRYLMNKLQNTWKKKSQKISKDVDMNTRQLKFGLWAFKKTRKFLIYNRHYLTEIGMMKFIGLWTVPIETTDTYKLEKMIY
jgi:hypothetical protein